MGLQDILKKILDEAKEVIKKLEEEKEQKKQILQKESDEIEKKALDEVEKKAQNTFSSVEKKTRSMANREALHEMLFVKQNLIKKAMQNFCDYLINLNENELNQIFKKFFEKITLNNGIIFVSPKHESLVKNLTGNNFEIKSDDKIKGGFIIKNKGSEIDCTFENLVFSEYKQEFTSFFAQKLNLL